nr:hypothetical protein BgiMline_009758 [Biomphalaria glabrata]
MSVRVHLYFERPKYKSISIYKMDLPSSKTIAELKSLIVHKIKNSPSEQRWYYNGHVLSDSSTLENVAANGIILVKICDSNSG